MSTAIAYASRGMNRLCLILLLASCTPKRQQVTFEYDQTTVRVEDSKRLEAVAEATFREARQTFPTLPEHLTLIVRSGTNVIPETGENGTASLPSQIAWTMGPGTSPRALIERNLRPTLLHELNHLARMQRHPLVTLMDAVISEGLATAYERDATGTVLPWGKWQDLGAEIVAWFHELQALPPDTDPSPWLIKHPDGRRWVGMRVGTFLVDCAMNASHTPAAPLVVLPTDEIVQRALPHLTKCALSPNAVPPH